MMMMMMVIGFEYIKINFFAAGRSSHDEEEKGKKNKLLIFTKLLD
jgi:hypothetical protein